MLKAVDEAAADAAEEEMTRTYKQQLADLLRRREYRGWHGQVTKRGYPSADKAEVVAELFSPTATFTPDDSSSRATYYLIRPAR